MRVPRCIPRSAALLIVLYSVLQQCQFTCAADDFEAVRAAVDQYWSSLSTIAFHDIEEISGKTARTEITDFKSALHGRWAIQTRDRRQDREKSVYDMREDGHRRYQVARLGDDFSVIHEVTISRPGEDPDHYSGVMTRALWIVLPAGRSPKSHLEMGARLSRAQDDNYFIETDHKGHPLRIVLDGLHDYLPRRVRLGDTLDIRVTRFEKIAGRWFPVAGEAESRNRSDGGGVVRSTFTLSQVRLNESLPETAFGPPTAGAGVQIRDTITGRSTVNGGVEAREALIKSIAPQQSATMPKVDARPSPRRFHFEYVLAAASVAALTIAIVLWRRGS